jgi:Tol biopolymer transport system component
MRVGDSIGPYHVLAKLGEGGMGEVYLARDPHLGRDVALKLLPPAVAADPERLARLAREARILASLDHPRIARLYHTVDQGDRHALVMEHVAGETLAETIARGPVSVEDTISILTQIADALDAAHRQQIVHRDLKPANVKRLPDGSIKVLDFGLAKAIDPDAAGRGDPSRAAADSPTILTPSMTLRGAVMGTAACMSPEQARGRAVDARTDIWAFGCLGFELLTGRPAFAGESTTDILAAVVGRDPEWDRLPPAAPPSLVRLLRRCLVKDPASRLRDIGDARLDLSDSAAECRAGGSPVPTRVPTRRWRAGLVWTTIAAAMFGAMAGAAGTRLWTRPSVEPASPTHLQVALPAGAPPFGVFDRHVAISPDGRLLAMTTLNGPLRLRRLDHDGVEPLPGTEGARSPFFSPDGRWIGFWSNGSIRKVSTDGGAASAVCESRGLFGASWGPDNRIVFGQGPLGIFEVSAEGGTPRSLATPDGARGERSFHGPQLLPGNQWLLFTLLATGRNWNDASIVIQPVAGGERRIVATGGSDARYLSSGHIVFGRANALMAVPFSLARMQSDGAPVQVLDRVRQSLLFESGAFSFGVSDTGTLVYVPAPPVPKRHLVWVDRNGREEPLPFAEGVYVHVRLSPDGRRIAVDDANLDLWVGDLERGTLSRLTTDRTFLHPVWLPGSDGLIFDSTQGGGLHRAALSGTSVDLLLRDPARMMSPVSVSPDGRVLAYERSEDYVSFDIAMVSTTGGAAPSDLVATSFRESAPMFSPDGRWLAFVSNETGRDEVYVQPFPGPGGKTLISTGGGREPLWSRDGRELFYRRATAMMSVPLGGGPTIGPGRATQLFEGTYPQEGFSAHPVYDVARDGRFVMVKLINPPAAAAPTVHVVLHWTERLRSLTSAR